MVCACATFQCFTPPCKKLKKSSFYEHKCISNLPEGINIDGKKEYNLCLSKNFFKHLPVKQNVDIAT